MNKKGKRLREFEKKNREFSVRDISSKKPRKHIEEVTEVKENSAKEQRKKKKIVVLNVKRLAISTIVLVFIVAIGVSGLKILSLRNEYDNLLERKMELEKLKAQLSNELEYVDSKEYIEQQARKSLKLVMDNEILFLLPEEDSGKDEK